MWEALRNRKLHGYKFRRQHPISDFIAYFYCHECKLIIELDGEYHNVIEQRQYDEGRTYELNELKIKVIRFTNREVLEDIDFVLDEIGVHLLEYCHENDNCNNTNPHWFGLHLSNEGSHHPSGMVESPSPSGEGFRVR